MVAAAAVGDAAVATNIGVVVIIEASAVAQVALNFLFIILSRRLECNNSSTVISLDI